jgi:Fur family ferric uptake transcriptional regulator
MRRETEYHREMPRNALRTLDEAGHRLTEPRRTVAAVLDGRDGHFTAAALLTDARARQPGIGRATVFRALDLFIDLGIVERVGLPNGEHAYVVCQPELHHHHVVCSSCGRTVDIDDRGIRAITKKVARRTGYRIEHHRVEMFGTCPACRRERPPAR